MFIEIRGEFYNTDNITKVKISEDSIHIVYTSGEATVIYGASDEELDILTKTLKYDDRRDSFEVLREEIRTQHGSWKASKAVKGRKRRHL